MTKTFSILFNTFILLQFSLISCGYKPTFNSGSIDQILGKKVGLEVVKKIYIDSNTILTQSFYGAGLSNELHLFGLKNGKIICLDSMTLFFHDEILQPDTIHFNSKYNCYVTNSEHSGTNVYGESIHFIQIKNERIVQTFEQLKYYSSIDPESNPISTFSVETELILFNQNVIQIKGTIKKGIIRDLDTENKEEISSEIDTVEYHFNAKTSTYTYFNSKLPAYKSQWKNNLFP